MNGILLHEHACSNACSKRPAGTNEGHRMMHTNVRIVRTLAAYRTYTAATYASEEHGTAWQWPTGNLNRRWVVQWQH